MAYRLSPDRNYTPEIRRIATEQLDSAIHLLSEQPDGVHEAVHGARKNFKRLRALYRLTAGGAADFRASENARIRDMARGLSAVRDATALVEVGRYLLDRAVTAEETAALTRICDGLAARRDEIAASEHDLGDKTAAAVAICAEAREALEGLEFDDRRRKTARRLQKTWSKGVRRARAALSDCESREDGQRFHELRKRSQDYWMFLALIRMLWPSAMRAKQAEAKQLAEILGHEHDLTVLSAHVNEAPAAFGDSGDLALLLSAIIVHQEALRGQAIEQARRIFADRPDFEGDRIAALWRKAAG